MTIKYKQVIATILQSSLEDIIDSEQTAAICGRSIIENLQLNWDIISYGNLNDLEAAIIMLDQEKAFDKVDREFLFKILQKSGYGPKLIAKIETIYKIAKIETKIGHRGPSKTQRTPLTLFLGCKGRTPRMPSLNDTVYNTRGSLHSKHKTK